MVNIQDCRYYWQPFTLVIDIYGSEWVEQSPVAVPSQLSSPHSGTPTTGVCDICQVAENSRLKHRCTTMELGQHISCLPDATDWNESSVSKPLVVTWNLPSHSQKQVSFLFTFLY